ncbi:partner of Y14 and mago B [Patella vulgata]|uniref:partner of Y14 and mago B n=1 Tax=Patella vulgata TaxID=6465 RepID=UPI0024A962F0|nr:partner of Y14 and mago B [Patella vulgata]
MATAAKAIERSGVVKDGVTGETFLPESRRPDGSIRKARRVKAGYVPQEEVPVYENKGMQWLKGRSDLPVGLSPDLMLKARAAKDAVARGDDVEQPDVGSNKKKGKKKAGETTGKQANRQKKGGNKKLEEDNDAVGDLLASVYGIKVTDEPAKKTVDQSGPNTDISRKLKNLQKKLKSTEKLEDKIKSGELKQPSKDELDKVARKGDLEAEIKQLQAQLEKS